MCISCVSGLAYDQAFAHLPRFVLQVVDPQNHKDRNVEGEQACGHQKGDRAS